MDISQGKTQLFSDKITSVYIDEATGDIDILERGVATTVISGSSTGMLLVAASNFLIRASRQPLYSCDKQMLREMIDKIQIELDTQGPRFPDIEELKPAEIAQINAEEGVSL